MAAGMGIEGNGGGAVEGTISRDPPGRVVGTGGAAIEGTIPGYPRARLLELADLTLAEFVLHLTRCGETAAIEDDGGVLLFAGAHPQPNPSRNGVIRTDPAVPAAETLERAGQFFATHRRGFALWASEHHDDDLHHEAEARGLTPLETLPE